MKLYKEFEPHVSIIIPTYNRFKYLTRAVDSVINQDYKSWEILLVDDGSEDDTFNLISDYQNKFNNIRYLRHTNRKPALTMNAGIQASCGKYITFLGSDDEYKPNHISSRIKILEADDKIDLLHGGIEIIGDPYVKDKNDLSGKIHLSQCTIGGTLFGKREVFFKLNGYENLEYSEDSDFYERAKKIFVTKDVELSTYKYYRDTPDSICSNI